MKLAVLPDWRPPHSWEDECTGRAPGTAPPADPDAPASLDELLADRDALIERFWCGEARIKTGRGFLEGRQEEDALRLQRLNRQIEERRR